MQSGDLLPKIFERSVIEDGIMGALCFLAGFDLATHSSVVLFWLKSCLLEPLAGKSFVGKHSDYHIVEPFVADLEEKGDFHYECRVFALIRRLGVLLFDPFEHRRVKQPF